MSDINGHLCPRPEYPRPELVRNEWQNLNGVWRYLEDPEDTGMQAGWYVQLPAQHTSIVVPFPIEAEASGVHNTQPPNVVWYEREFELPASWEGRIALRFGAVDHRCRVFVNGQEVGQHRGGYTPFSFDIEHGIKKDAPNRITVRVEDSLSWTQPRGKQAGTTRWPIDYDSVTGIWQTVWIEPLPPVSIETVWSDFNLNANQLTLHAGFSKQVDGQFEVELLRDNEVIARGEAETGLRAECRVQLDIDNPKLWSPESPQLYDIRLTLRDNNSGTRDNCTSYTGLRELRVDNGELLLNGKPVYIRGVLDQGYFPKGWYAAETDDDIRRDVELTLAMGLNCARKHQKAEDPRYLYWADRLGLMVWAEMPSGKIFGTELIETLTREWMQLIKRDRCHPSVIAWVPFNESWGVWHQAERIEQRRLVDGIVGLTTALDPSRPVIGNDGWEYSSGDIWTLHLYNAGDQLSSRLNEMIHDPSTSVTEHTGGARPRAGALPGASVGGLPIMLTECGGIGFGHFGDEDFSYGDIPATEDELASRMRHTMETIANEKRLRGFVWTQLSDVQQEINGLLYFDRTPKLPLEQIRAFFQTTAGS